MVAKRWPIAAVLVILLAAGAAAQEVPALVDPGWIIDHRGDPDVLVLDVRTDVVDYWEGHIPGSVYLSPQALQAPRGGVPVQLAPAEAREVTFTFAGLEEDTHVILAGPTSGPEATYVAWALMQLGHGRVSVLDGGYRSWNGAGHDLEQDFPERDAGEGPRVEIADMLRIDMAEMLASREREEVVLLDVRPEAMYRGDEGPWLRRGHIPGAVNRFFQRELTGDGRYRSPATLRAEWMKLGVEPTHRVVVSCGSGYTSSVTWYLLHRVLGYPRVGIFDGSFSQWADREDLPVATGTQP